MKVGIFVFFVAIAASSLADANEKKSGPCNGDGLFSSKFIDINLNPIVNVDSNGSNFVLVSVPVKLDSNDLANVSIRKQSDSTLEIPLRSIEWESGDASSFSYFMFHAGKKWLAEDYCVQVSYTVSKYGHVSSVAKYLREIKSAEEIKK